MAKPSPEVAKIAQDIVARLDIQQPKKGVLRNREAIALVIGAAIAAEAIDGHRPLAGYLRMLAFLTSTRGAIAVEEIAKELA